MPDGIGIRLTAREVSVIAEVAIRSPVRRGGSISNRRLVFLRWWGCRLAGVRVGRATRRQTHPAVRIFRARGWHGHAAVRPRAHRAWGEARDAATLRDPQLRRAGLALDGGSHARLGILRLFR